MPRNFTKYQYETSPRKLKPEYTPPKKEDYKPKKSTISKKTKLKEQIKKEKKRKARITAYVLIGFAILFVISYRNSQIDETFSEVQKLKRELSDIEKENVQMEVAIENSLNFSNIEKEAKEQLGMQKLTNKQTVYVNLPKNDYIEAKSEDVIIDEETSIIDSIINTIKNIFK